MAASVSNYGQVPAATIHGTEEKPLLSVRIRFLFATNPDRDIDPEIVRSTARDRLSKDEWDGVLNLSCLNSKLLALPAVIDRIEASPERVLRTARVVHMKATMEIILKHCEGHLKDNLEHVRAIFQNNLFNVSEVLEAFAASEDVLSALSEDTIESHVKTLEEACSEEGRKAFDDLHEGARITYTEPLWATREANLKTVTDMLTRKRALLSSDT